MLYSDEGLKRLYDFCVSIIAREVETERALVLILNPDQNIDLAVLKI